MPLSSTSLVRCQVTTERMIRQQLQEQTGVDVSDRKAFIKQQVTRRWHTTFFSDQCWPARGSVRLVQAIAPTQRHHWSSFL